MCLRGDLQSVQHTAPSIFKTLGLDWEKFPLKKTLVGGKKIEIDRNFRNSN